MIASSAQASTSPSGSASSAVSAASATLRSSSIRPSCRRVRPIAQTGASCGRRVAQRVRRLVRIANPATPSVRTLSAPVTTKVFSKIARDCALIAA